MKTVELNDTEAFLLTVALREYLSDSSGHRSDTVLRDHTSTRAILEQLVERIDPSPDRGAANTGSKP